MNTAESLHQDYDVQPMNGLHDTGAQIGTGLEGQAAPTFSAFARPAIYDRGVTPQDIERPDPSQLSEEAMRRIDMFRIGVAAMVRAAAGTDDVIRSDANRIVTAAARHYGYQSQMHEFMAAMEARHQRMLLDEEHADDTDEGSHDGQLVSLAGWRIRRNAPAPRRKPV